MARDKDKARSAYSRAEWIFDWKLSVNSTLNSWLAIMVVSGLAVLLTLALRVRIAEPVPGVVEQADILQLGQGRMGRLLAMEAKAKGPFPSRYEPESGSPDELGDALGSAMRVREQTHVAQLSPLPEADEQMLRLAARGEPTLPQRPLPPAAAAAPRQTKLIPKLRAISGLAADELPAQLPAWDKESNEKLAANPWRFMMMLDRSGRVRECIDMTGGNEPGTASIRAWLAAITFQPKAQAPDQRWIAVAVDFENQTSAHGTEPH